MDALPITAAAGRMPATGAPSSPAQPLSMPGARPADHAQLRQTAEDFEAMFVSQMLSQMFAGIETDGVFGGGAGEDVYRALMLDQYGQEIARSGRLGIADAVMRQLISAQEGEQS